MNAKTIIHWTNLRITAKIIGFPLEKFRKTAGYGVIEEGIGLFCYAKQARYPIVELGSFIGKSAIALSEGSQQGTKQKVFCIDPHKAEYYDKQNNHLFTYKPEDESQFHTNIRKSKGFKLIKTISDYSYNVIKNWKLPIGLLFIDANHEYNAVKQDFQQWSPWIVKNGIMAMHDSVSSTDVQRFLSELDRNEDYKLETRIWNTTYWRKKI